jgi:hypothetical protein
MAANTEFYAIRPPRAGNRITRGEGFMETVQSGVPSSFFVLGLRTAKDIDAFNNGVVREDAIIVAQAADLAQQEPPLTLDQSYDFFGGVLWSLAERRKEIEQAATVGEGITV